MAEVTRTTNEAAVVGLLDEWERTLRSRDLEALMSHYAHDPVLYDGIAPLQIKPDQYRSNWQSYFTFFPGPVGFQARNVRVVAGDTAAFVTRLVHLSGTSAEGKEEGAWMRETVGCQRIDGRWRIVHEHWSLPIDMESGKGVTDLQPE
jgi:ketosteroid isomerase-like protein